MDETNYYVRRQGRVDGPWSVGKLRSEIALRKLGRHHELSEDGNTWMRAGEIEGLFASSAGKKRLSRAIATAPVSAPNQSAEATGEIEVELAADASAEEPAIWYCLVDDRQSGPLSTARLAAAVDEGKLPLNTIVWREGYADWVPLQDVTELTDKLTSTWQYTTASNATTRLDASPRDRAPHAGYALWLGVGSLFICWIPIVGLLAILPIVFGAITIRDVRRSEGKQRGIGAGVTGIILGSFSLAIAMLEILLLIAAVANSHLN
jgi:GYF domain 2